MILDSPHKDLRRARAAAINLDPDLDGRREGDRPRAAGAQGKVDGISVRAPVATGSLTDLVVSLGPRDDRRRGQGRVSRGGGRPARRASSSTREDPLVSTDIVGNAYSCIFDSGLTMVHGSTVKVFGWYDNEWGYSCRLVDLIGKLLAVGCTARAPFATRTSRASACSSAPT